MIRLDGSRRIARMTEKGFAMNARAESLFIIDEESKIVNQKTA